jgi:hypothetical protein
MAKNLVLAIVAICALGSALLAQTPAHKHVQTVRPNTNAPTKVTGDGVKTESGLQ